MTAPHTVFQAIEFIEAHLKEAITVAAMAEAVGYSLYHFCRTFNAAVHHTPYDYLMRRRLSEAARTLVETDQKIIDIAFEHQFNSPETFSRAFKRMFGTQPQQWRKQGRLDPRQLMIPLTLAHLQHLHCGKGLKPVLVEKPAFQVAGLMTLVQNDPGIVDQLWKVLRQELEGLDRTGHLYGIAWYPPIWEKSGYFYLAAAEVASPDAAGPGLVVKTIPALTYASFIHLGNRANLKLTLDYIYQTWLPQSGRRLACPLEIEHLSRKLVEFGDEQAQWEIYIPIE